MTLRIAVNPWTGYVSNAHVIGYVAQTELGCTVTYPEVKEEVGWQGMADGSIDTIVENWGHTDDRELALLVLVKLADGPAD